MIGRFINVLLCGIVGGVLASAKVRTSDWQFWVILICVIGANICGYISGLEG